MREIDECDMEEFDTLDSENTIVILGDRWNLTRLFWSYSDRYQGTRRCQHTLVDFNCGTPMIRTSFSP